MLDEEHSLGAGTRLVTACANSYWKLANPWPYGCGVPRAWHLKDRDHQETKRIPIAIRGHWSIENLNHYKRDTSLWREDDHRQRRVPIAQNLALTRNARLAVTSFTTDQPLASCFERYQRSPAQAIQLILYARPAA